MTRQLLLYKPVVAVALATIMTTTARAHQQSVPQADVALSEPVHTALYPEIICAGCVEPQWDGRFLLHKDINKDPSVVTIYDASGNKVLTGRISTPDFSNVSVIAVATTHNNGILAGAAGDMTDGNRKGFIAKTDSAGHTVQSVLTVNFEPDHVCEAADGTVWTLGSSWGEDKNVLRHYSFEKRLRGTFISLSSKKDAPLEVSSGARSYLHCGNERVAIYLALSGQYIELNTSTNKVSSWKIDASSAVGDEPRGFAVTDDGRIFVALAKTNRAHGLYELHPVDGMPVVTLTPVLGTVSAQDSDNEAPRDALLRLWGADGNELVVQRRGDWPGLVWVKVTQSTMAPD